MRISTIVALIMLIGAISFGIYMISSSQPSYENKGKMALINEKDTCKIISEDKDFFFKAYPPRTRVLYKDNYGKWIEQDFHSDLITIINNK